MTSGTDSSEREITPPGVFVQFTFFKVAREWRSLPADTRRSGLADFAAAVGDGDPAVQTHSYSTVGLSGAADLMLWRTATAPEPLQEGLARLLHSGLGSYLEVAELFFGLTRPSVYTGRRTPQEQAIDAEERLPYFVLYPFTKTVDWYLISREVRQGMMNEHIKVGRTYPSIRQILLYSTGLADQEFIVAYETTSLGEFQELVIALRSTEARRYTLRDTPIFTCIHRPIEDALALL